MPPKKEVEALIWQDLRARRRLRSQRLSTYTSNQREKACLSGAIIAGLCKTQERRKIVFLSGETKKEKGLEDEEKDKKGKENVIRRIKRKGRKILKIGRTEERNGTR